MRCSAIVPTLDCPVQLFINAETQNKSNPGYPLLMRGVFYACRMISDQYGTVFTHSDYGKIRKVYSVWICPRPAKQREYTINSYAMQEDHLAGEWNAEPSHYDLITVIVINLGTKAAHELTGLFRLLNAIFLDKMKPEELGRILTEEYSIRLTPSLKKGVETMCNLSEGLVEEGIQKGIHDEQIRQEAQRKEEETTRILSMLRDKFSPDVIAKYSPFSLERIQELGRANGLL